MTDNIFQESAKPVDVQPMEKKEINRIFYKWPVHKLRQEYLDVIEQIRKVSRKEARDTKHLEPGEVVELFRRLDKPLEIRTA